MSAVNDYVGTVLHYLNLNSVFYCRSELHAPWGLQLPALPDTLMLHVVVSGTCWLECGDVRQQLRPGDFALVPHGQGHRLRSKLNVAAKDLFALQRDQISNCYEQLVIDGEGERTVLLCGVVQLEHPSARHLIASLPPIILLEHTATAFSEWTQSTVKLIALEAQNLKLGGETVITRLADILVIQAIRAWMENSTVGAGGWLAALRDEKIGKALNFMHSNPGHAWTIESLGKAVGMSRAAFAARFGEMTGESVMQYLTAWRMHTALHCIQQGHGNIGELSERLGYQSEAAFRRTFKKILGFNPGEAKTRQRSFM